MLLPRGFQGPGVLHLHKHVSWFFIQVVDPLGRAALQNDEGEKKAHEGRGRGEISRWGLVPRPH
jgi:hypothetical protein